jgi:PHD/YefM family antitoxin component YafN of YafNO toxin-antitoxin module
MQTYPFPSTVSAREIQRGYKKIFATVKKTRKPVVVMANNTPQAAIVSLEMLEKYNQLQMEQELWKAIDVLRMRNKDKDSDRVMEDITRDIKEVRKKMYAETFGSR